MLWAVFGGVGVMAVKHVVVLCFSKGIMLWAVFRGVGVMAVKHVVVLCFSKGVMLLAVTIVGVGVSWQ